MARITIMKPSARVRRSALISTVIAVLMLALLAVFIAVPAPTRGDKLTIFLGTTLAGIGALVGVVLAGYFWQRLYRWALPVADNGELDAYDTRQIVTFVLSHPGARETFSAWRKSNPRISYRDVDTLCARLNLASEGNSAAAGAIPKPAVSPADSRRN